MYLYIIIIIYGVVYLILTVLEYVLWYALVFEIVIVNGGRATIFGFKWTMYSTACSAVYYMA